MPARQALLDEGTRQQLRAASRRRYEEKCGLFFLQTKNGGTRRQRSACRGNGPSPYIPHDPPLASVRAGIAASDYFTQRKYREKAAIHSENYRDRRVPSFSFLFFHPDLARLLHRLDAAQREQRRIADAETRRARKQEARALRKHATAHIPAPHAKLTTPRCDKDRGVGIEMFMIRIDCSDDSEEGRCTNPNQRWRYDGYRTDEDTDAVRTMVETIGLSGADGDLNLVASLWACFLQSDARENGDPNRGSLNMCGLPPAVNDGRRVHERYEVGEGWEYPFRLSESGTESGENAPRATSPGWELLTTPSKCAPFYTFWTTSHVSRGAMRVAGTGKVRPAREVVWKRQQKGSATRSATGGDRSYRGVSAKRIVHVEESVGLDRRRREGGESKAGRILLTMARERVREARGCLGNGESVGLARKLLPVTWFAGAMRRRAVHSTLGDLTAQAGKDSAVEVKACPGSLCIVLPPAPPEQEEDTEDSEDGEDGGTLHPLPQPFFEACAPHPNRLRCKACRLDDCPGCACMCEASTLWFDHPGGHFFRDCKSYGATDCPGCAYRDTHTGGFFAVVHENFKGVVTSECYQGVADSHLDKIPWCTHLQRIHMTLDCTEYHEHQGEMRKVHARHNLRVRQQRRNEEHHFKLVALAEAIRVEEEEEKCMKEEMDYLAATRPPPVPLSPQHARQQFDRVLGPGAGTPPFALRKGGLLQVSTPSQQRYPARCKHCPLLCGRGRPGLSLPQTPLDAGTLLEEAHRRTSRLQGLPAYSDVQASGEGEAPGLYAVHAGSYNCVFNSRARVVEVLQETPNTELVFIGNEQCLWQFLDRVP
ncbi:hypothetical protein B0H14DRAFT_2588101 [Mycena olivaceomarginata]|nr:hypothetical protein B0H14DRAFT_2588101 [Mycena olivaceomarginata]